VKRRQHVIVHLVDVVARQDQDRIGAVMADKVQVLVDRIRRALVPITIAGTDVGLEQGHAPGRAIQVPGLAGTDVVVEGVGPILGADTHGKDARIDAVGERKVNDPVFAGERDGRLGPFLRQDAQPAAGTTRQNHRQGAHPVSYVPWSSMACW
jgi:hypothetical protein